MSDDKKGNLGIEDAIRLKHSVNRGITYGKLELNAEQIKAIQNIDDDSRKQLRDELIYISKSWYLFPYWFWVVGLLVGGGCVLYFSHIYALIGSLVIMRLLQNTSQILLRITS